MKRMWGTAQVDGGQEMLLHGQQLSISQLTILSSDSIYDQPEFLLLQTEHDL